MGARDISVLFSQLLRVFNFKIKKLRGERGILGKKDPFEQQPGGRTGKVTAPEGFPWLQAIVTSQPCWSHGACWVGEATVPKRAEIQAVFPLLTHPDW